MFPKEGKKARAHQKPKDYAYAISCVLRSELGSSSRATKTLTSWTGATDRTVKDWMSGRYGPSGQHLIALAGRCDAVLSLVLVMAGRHRCSLAGDLATIRLALQAAAERLEECYVLDT